MATEEPAIGLIVRVDTPRGRTEVTTALSARVHDFVTQATAAKSIPGPAGYALEVPLQGDEGKVEWHEVDDGEAVLDALRGVQRMPRIVERGEDEH